MILICINPFYSHVMPTLKLARELSKKGNEVVYIGFDGTREIIENEGFKYISLKSCKDEEIQDSKRLHKYSEMQNLFKSIHIEIFEKVRNLKVGRVLFHISRFDVFFIPLYSLNLNLLSYDTCFGSIEFNASIPPSTSSYIPKVKWDIRNIYFWSKRYIRKVKDLKWNTIRKMYPYSIYDEIAKKENLKKCFCIDGFYLRLPHIKFTPREVEFRSEEKMYYAGLCLEPVLQTGKLYNLVKDKRQLIYCSLGTMNYRYLKTNSFFNALIEIMKRHKEFVLVITLGERGKKLEVEKLPDNVTICDFVNQREILEHADLVITHGGAGTVKECIYHEVPMVVSPSVYDQMGNAARIHFHRIGLRNNYMRKSFLEHKLGKNIHKINVDYLEKQIITVLNNPEYKNNIVSLKHKIYSNNDFNKLVCYLSE